MFRAGQSFAAFALADVGGSATRSADRGRSLSLRDAADDAPANPRIPQRSPPPVRAKSMRGGSTLVSPTGQHDMVAVAQVQCPGLLRRDQQRIVPRQLGQWPWQLLQPRIVCEPAVPEVGSGRNNKVTGCCGGAGGRTCTASSRSFASLAADTVFGTTPAVSALCQLDAKSAKVACQVCRTRSSAGAGLNCMNDVSN